MSRRWTTACVAFVALVLGACAGGASGEGIPPVTTCAIPYTFSLPQHRSLRSGSCAGLLPPAPPPRATVRRGQTFSVRIMHGQNGRLDFPIPRPAAGSVGIVRRVGATIIYRGATRGVALLFARHTRFCAGIDPRIGSCAVLKVIVVGG